jgi:hypothetical protein
MDAMDGQWGEANEPIRDRGRNDGRDPSGGGSAAAESGADPVGHPVAALRCVRASGGDRVLCETPCNIRVDLVFFFPILALATFCAYQSYIGRPGQHKVIGTVLGAVALLVVGLVAEGHGYRTLASVVVVVGALAIGVYAIKSRSRANRT